MCLNVTVGSGSLIFQMIPPISVGCEPRSPHRRFGLAPAIEGRNYDEANGVAHRLLSPN